MATRVASSAVAEPPAGEEEREEGVSSYEGRAVAGRGERDILPHGFRCIHA